jgi:hypothetical protein
MEGFSMFKELPYTSYMSKTGPRLAKIKPFVSVTSARMTKYELAEFIAMLQYERARGGDDAEYTIGISQKGYKVTRHCGGAQYGHESYAQGSDCGTIFDLKGDTEIFS